MKSIRNVALAAALVGLAGFAAGCASTGDGDGSKAATEEEESADHEGEGPELPGYDASNKPGRLEAGGMRRRRYR